MAEYIDRQAVLDAIFPVDPENDGSDGCTVVLQSQSFTSADIEGIVCSIPAADVRQVMHAHWKPVVTVGGAGFLECSRCGYKEHDHVKYTRFNFFPNCGAQMDGGAAHEH